jgi:hypothetical protein
MSSRQRSASETSAKAESPATPAKRLRAEKVAGFSDATRFTSIARALDHLTDVDWLAPFYQPVDEARDDAAGYYTKVRDPVCFEIIYHRLERGVYSDVPPPPRWLRPKARKATEAARQAEEPAGSRTLRSDLCKLHSNSVAFNGPNSFVTHAAQRMLHEFAPAIFALLAPSGDDLEGPDGSAQSPLDHEAAEDPITAAVEAERAFGTSATALRPLVAWCAEHGVKVERANGYCFMDMTALSDGQRKALARLRRAVV